MTTWVNDCNKTHESCQRAASRLPTRVLDVSRDHRNVYLHETAPDEEGNYVCLSYCWGQAKTIVTDSANFHTHLKGIAIEDLPLTFREAVDVVKKLDYRYLWIDALCIIQDSTDDWSTEASRMAEVYGGASVTLVAAASSDSDGGLFQHHTNPSSSCVIQSTCPDGTLIKAYVQPTLAHSRYLDGGIQNVIIPIRAPWLTRAWCFQGKGYPRAHSK